MLSCLTLVDLVVILYRVGPQHIPKGALHPTARVGIAEIAAMAETESELQTHLDALKEQWVHNGLILTIQAVGDCTPVRVGCARRASSGTSG